MSAESISQQNPLAPTPVLKFSQEPASRGGPTISPRSASPDCFESTPHAAHRPVALDLRAAFVQGASTRYGQAATLFAGIGHIALGAVIGTIGVISLIQSPHAVAIVVLGTAWSPITVGMTCLALAVVHIGLGAYVLNIAAEGRAFRADQSTGVDSNAH